VSAVAAAYVALLATIAATMLAVERWRGRP
jgi:hypothetical protein